MERSEPKDIVKKKLGCVRHDSLGTPESPLKVLLENFKNMYKSHLSKMKSNEYH